MRDGAVDNLFSLSCKPYITRLTERWLFFDQSLDATLADLRTSIHSTNTKSLKHKHLDINTAYPPLPCMLLWINWGASSFSQID